MQALAYTQADQVYIAPGQERHLGHELGHIVQKRRGQVRATCSLNGQAVNDNPALEKEADTMASHVSGCLTHAEETEKKWMVSVCIWRDRSEEIECVRFFERTGWTTGNNR